jgi:hypothetical protein
MEHLLTVEYSMQSEDDSVLEGYQLITHPTVSPISSSNPHHTRHSNTTTIATNNTQHP